LPAGARFGRAASGWERLGLEIARTPDPFDVRTAALLLGGVRVVLAGAERGATHATQFKITNKAVRCTVLISQLVGKIWPGRHARTLYPPFS